MSEPVVDRVSGAYRIIYKHRPLMLMIGVSIFYAMLMVIALPLVDMTEGRSIACVIYPVGVATFALAASWAVFGLGSVLLRFLVATAIASVVLLGFTVGFMLTEDFWEDSDSHNLIIALSFFTALVLAQIPFWAVRAIAGWHWSFTSNDVKPLISLRDMFFVMLVFSVAVSASQWGARITADAARAEVVVGQETYVFNEDPGQAGEFQMVTPENVESLRAAQVQGALIQMPFIVSLYFVIPTLLVLPVFWWALRGKRMLSSWVWSLLYALGLAGVFLLLGVVMGGGADINLEMVVLTILAVGMALFFVWVPLVLMRMSGLELRTKKHPYETVA